MFGFFCSSMLSFINNNFVAFQISYVEKPIRYLLLIPVFLLVKRVELYELWFFLGAAFGAFNAGVYATYQHFVLLIPRALGGSNNAIVFGDVAICLSIICLIGMISYRHHAVWLRLFLLLGVLGGLVASIFSESRGGWIAIPVVAVVFLWAYRKELGRTGIAFMLLSLMLVFTVLYQISATGVSRRVDAAIDNVKAYYLHDDYLTSAGQRFEMFKAAWILFREKPWLGFGPGSFIREANRLEKQGKVRAIADDLAHPHNEYLDEMSGRGIVGLIVLLALYFFPVLYFSGQYSKKASSMALAGVLIPLAYMIFSLTESVLDRLITLVFYQIVMFYIFALHHQRSGYGKKTAVN